MTQINTVQSISVLYNFINSFLCLWRDNAMNEQGRERRWTWWKSKVKGSKEFEECAKLNAWIPSGCLQCFIQLCLNVLHECKLDDMSVLTEWGCDRFGYVSNLLETSSKCWRALPPGSSTTTSASTSRTSTQTSSPSLCFREAILQF